MDKENVENIYTHTHIYMYTHIYIHMHNVYICMYMYTHTMEYYSALQRKGILSNDTTWVNFEDISEISQSQKHKFCMDPLTRGV